MGFESGNISQPEWESHMSEKKRAEREHAMDKSLALEQEDLVMICMDLQGVLLAPSINSSCSYFKTKLSVHNFTIFNVASRDAMCYVWHEAQGGLTANEFTSCLMDFLSTCTQARKVIIYSDGCVYQNKNAVLSSALSAFSTETNTEIEHKYLVKGHTHMEVDSMHSVIERRLQKTQIYSPLEYLTIFRTARINPRPYDVKFVDHTFFRDFAKIAVHKTIRPGRKKGDPTVNEIRSLRYVPDGEILYKPLKIKKSKFEDLQSLKAAIPAEHHSFYDNLPH